jgi:hypothetical protein
VSASAFLDQLIIVNGLLLGFSMNSLHQLAMSGEHDGGAADHGHEQAYRWSLGATALLFASLWWGLFTLQAGGRWEGQPIETVPPLLNYAIYIWPALLLAGILAFLWSIATLAWRHKRSVQVFTTVVITALVVVIVLTWAILGGL